MTLAYTLTTVATVIAVAAFVTGLMSFMKSKERSILVFVAMAIGLSLFIGGTVSLLGLAE